MMSLVLLALCLLSILGAWVSGRLIRWRKRCQQERALNFIADLFR